MHTAVIRTIKQRIDTLQNEHGRATEDKLLSTVAADMGAPEDEVQRVYDHQLKRGELYKHKDDDGSTVVKITERQL